MYRLSAIILHYCRLLPTLSLTQLGFYDAFNTLLLSCENAPSPYWGPKHYLTEELGLTLGANAKPAFVHFWKPGCNSSSDRLISYPVYNLGHTCGKPRKTERYHLRTSNPEMTDPEIARHVRSIVQLMVNNNCVFSDFDCCF